MSKAPNKIYITEYDKDNTNMDLLVLKFPTLMNIMRSLIVKLYNYECTK